ncbi:MULTISPECIES: ATP-binding protein [Streptomyces]|uniref:ATP-binding protein n=2 Tax=Streptomyces TaxID=1883 RepID=A0ABV9J3K8_9ACTN
MVTRSRVPGRGRECEQLEELLDAVRGGESRALVVRGEPGARKTTLLEYLVDQARGFRIARVTSIQSEMELAFAGLHRLCGPMLDRRHRLPPRRGRAGGTAADVAAGLGPCPRSLPVVAVTVRWGRGRRRFGPVRGWWGCQRWYAR